MILTLSRSHFKKGFDDTLTLKPLRQAIGLTKDDKSPKGDTGGKGHTVLLVKKNNTWHVKRAS